MRSPNIRWLRLLGFTAALAAVLFMAAGAEYWHSHAPGTEAACTICHASHMPALQSASPGAVAAPAPVAWIVPEQKELAVTAPSYVVPPPRAPPA